MLIKGSHVHEGVDTLVDVICRMQNHQGTVSSRMRALGSR